MRTIFTGISLLVIVSTSCKKDDYTKKKNDHVNPVNCRIIAASLSAFGNYEFQYNKEGKLIKANRGDTVITYSYQANKIIVTTFCSGVFHTKATVLLNDSKQPISTTIEYDTTGTEWENYIYEYEGIELKKWIGTSSSNSSPRTETFNWNNGNITSVTMASGANVNTTEFNYYTDKLKQPGDYISFIELLQGYELFKNKNLINSIDATKFAYDFTPDGKISSLKATADRESELFTAHYQYQCQ